ncbi:hypothetical protein ABH922_004459 [Rhodococcus sp. 27YEA15]
MSRPVTRLKISAISLCESIWAAGGLEMRFWV